MYILCKNDTQGIYKHVRHVWYFYLKQQQKILSKCLQCGNEKSIRDFLCTCIWTSKDVVSHPSKCMYMTKIYIKY